MTHPSFAWSAGARAAIATSWFWVLVSPAVFAEAHDADPEAVARKSWREGISHLAAPHEGCFEAGYPRLDWTEVDCVSPPLRPYGRRPQTRIGAVGGQGLGDDYFVRSAAGPILGATGSFTHVAAHATQDFSLQLVTNPKETGECINAEFCDAWQQFVVSSGTGLAFMQYWALGSGTSCPAGWTLRQGECYQSSPAIRVPKLPIAALRDASLRGMATREHDQLIFIASNRAYSVAASDDVVGLSTFWRETTFNVFGDCCERELQFAPGSALEVRIDLDAKTSEQPECNQAIDWSREMNNLDLGTCTAYGGRDPHALITESN